MADLTGGLQVGAGATSITYTTPYPHQVGSRARDASGNEYVFVDFVGTVNGRQPVQINSDYTAQAVTTTGRGPIGVAVTGPVTSDSAGWVQIYGYCLMQLITSGVSPSAEGAPTTLSTSAATQFWLPTSVTSPQGLRWTSGNTCNSSGIIILGMSVATNFAVGDVSAQTSGTSISGIGHHSGCQVAVFLNYPQAKQINFGE